MGSDSSDVPDDWENASVHSEPEVVKSQPSKATAAPAPAAQRKEYKVPAHLATPLDDPDAEAERKRLVQEDRDMFMAADLFGVDNSVEDEIAERSKKLIAKLQGPSGKTTKQTLTDAECLERIQVGRWQEMELLLSVLEPKLSASMAKSGVFLQFLDRLVSACAAKMDPQDLKTLEKKILQLQRKRQVEKKAAQTSSKKGTDLKVNYRNFEDELDIFDGKDGDSEDKDSQMSDDDEGIM